MVEELGDKTTVILTGHCSIQQMPGCCKGKVSCGVFQLLHRQLFFAYDFPLRRLSQPLRLCPSLLCQRDAQALCFFSPLFEETSNLSVSISKHALMLR